MSDDSNSGVRLVDEIQVYRMLVSRRAAVELNNLTRPGAVCDKSDHVVTL